MAQVNGWHFDRCSGQRIWSTMSHEQRQPYADLDHQLETVACLQKELTKARQQLCEQARALGYGDEEIDYMLFLAQRPKIPFNGKERQH